MNEQPLSTPTPSLRLQVAMALTQYRSESLTEENVTGEDMETLDGCCRDLGDVTLPDDTQGHDVSLPDPCREGSCTSEQWLFVRGNDVVLVGMTLPDYCDDECDAVMEWMLGPMTIETARLEIERKAAHEAKNYAEVMASAQRRVGAVLKGLTGKASNLPDASGMGC